MLILTTDQLLTLRTALEHGMEFASIVRGGLSRTNNDANAAATAAADALELLDAAERDLVMLTLLGALPGKLTQH